MKRKKILAILLAVSLGVGGGNTAWAVEFSDGSSGNDVQITAEVRNEAQVSEIESAEGETESTGAGMERNGSETALSGIEQEPVSIEIGEIGNVEMISEPELQPDGALLEEETASGENGAEFSPEEPELQENDPQESNPETETVADLENEDAAMLFSSGEPIEEDEVMGMDLTEDLDAEFIGAELNETNFPDPQFRKYVSQFDVNGDGTFSSEEIQAVTSMRVSGGGNEVTSLRGIEYFQNLKVLDCSSIGLYSLDVRSLTNLEELYCQGENVFSSLDLSGMTSLRIVNCGNRFDGALFNLVKTDGLVNLESFECNSTNIRELDLSDSPKLQSLVIADSNLTTLELNSEAVVSDMRVSTSGIHADIYPFEDGWKLNLKNLINEKDAGNMEFVSWETNLTYAEGPEAAEIVGDYLYIYSYFNPKKLYYNWNTGSADGYKMLVGINLESPMEVEPVDLTYAEIVQEDSVLLAWEPLAGAAGYYICYAKPAEDDNLIIKVLDRIEGGDQTYYFNDRVGVGNPYYYWVSAYAYLNPNNENSEVRGDLGQGLSVMQTFSEEPLTIKSLKSVSPVANKITWAKRSKASGYMIYRRKAGEKWTKLATVGKSTTSYEDRTCVSGTKYYYTVKAYKKASDGQYYYSKYITNKTVTTKKSLATVPLGKAKVVTGSHIQITWEKVSGADYYWIYRKKSGGSFEKIKVCAGDILKYTDTSTVIGETYTYTVRACAEGEEQVVLGAYNKTGISAKQTYDSKEVVISSVKALDTTSVEITWEAKTKSTGYRIFRKTEGGTWKRIATVKKNLSYVDTTCEPGTLYYYTVKAYKDYNKKAVYSKFNSGIGVTLGLAPAALGKVYITSADNIRVYWKEVPGADGYLVYRRLSGGSWSRIAKVTKAGRLYYSDTTASMGKTYQYRVRAYSYSGKKNVYSKYSPASSEIQQIFHKNPVKVSSAKALSKTSVQLKWVARKKAKTYRIYRKTANSAWSRIAIVNGETTSYKDTKCKKGTTYYYEVRAYTDGIMSTYTTPSKVTTKK